MGEIPGKVIESTSVELLRLYKRGSSLPINLIEVGSYALKYFYWKRVLEKRNESEDIPPPNSCTLKSIPIEEFRKALIGKLVISPRELLIHLALGVK